MSRTKRVYNRPNGIFGVYEGLFGWQPYWHPWKTIYGSGPPGRKAARKYEHKQQRAHMKNYIDMELEQMYGN